MLVPYPSGLLKSLSDTAPLRHESLDGLVHVKIVDLYWGFCKGEHEIELLGVLPALKDCHSKEQTDCWSRCHWGICLPAIDALYLLASIHQDSGMPSTCKYLGWQFCVCVSSAILQVEQY